MEIDGKTKGCNGIWAESGAESQRGRNANGKKRRDFEAVSRNASWERGRA